MTPRARRMLEAHRRLMPVSRVMLRRPVEEGDPPECHARARVTDVRMDELVGGMGQTIRTVIVLAEEVTFEPPLRAGDEVILPSGHLLTIEICDADKRSVDGTLIAYELTVKG